jgi:hypothetical protein
MRIDQNLLAPRAATTEGSNNDRQTEDIPIWAQNEIFLAAQLGNAYFAEQSLEHDLILSSPRSVVGSLAGGLTRCSTGFLALRSSGMIFVSFLLLDANPS